MDWRRKTLVQVGSKSLELVDEGEGERLRFRLVERGAGVRIEVWVKDIELQWVCLILEDASLGYEQEFSRSYGGSVRRLKVSRIPFVGCFYLRMEVRDGGRLWSVCLPELAGSGGWVDISRNFWEFCGWKCLGGLIDCRSFVDVANIGDWPVNTVEVVEKGRKRKGCDVEVRAESTQNTSHFLERCLVGWMEEGGSAQPTAMEVQRWAQRTWKVTAGVQVSDLGGVDFLFTLPSVEEAQRVMRSSWSFAERRVQLEWWSPVGYCFKKGEAPSVVWVRILGLPLHLWDSEVFREIGDFCGGFVSVDVDMRRRINLHWARIAVRAAPEKIPAKVKVAMGGWVFDLRVWVEKGRLVVFQPVLNIENGDMGVSNLGSGGRELTDHRMEKTRGGNSRRARGGWVNGSFRNRRFSNFESQISCGLGRGVGRCETNVNWVKPNPVHLGNIRSGSDAKWAYLFKRPVRSNLVEIKNRRWVSVGDQGGGPSFSGALSQKKGGEQIDGTRPGTVGNHSQSIVGDKNGLGKYSLAIVDASEVCMIPNRLIPSSPSYFSFLEEGGSGWVFEEESGKTVGEKSGEVVNEERVVVNNLSRGDCFSFDVVGQQSSASEMGVGEGTGRAFRGCSIGAEEGDLSTRGMELVPFSGLTDGGCSVWDNQREELFKNLGWVEEVLEDGQLVCSDPSNPLINREPVGTWIDEDKLMVGMSQEEVSNWVLKRISGFSKFLGVSYDGFEDRTMRLFLDIEEKWRKGAVKVTKKGGSKVNSGARELKRLECSINYDGRKKEGEKGFEGVEGVNLLSFYED
ncbi:hypothetical protein RHGRI_029397 [Rhododendron griersonianum]|uniref:DUF4283 domain-containing protein n=1 Tax=Rhododendron griersonianum TaxID=479676 RepID=A0AAV6IMG0_9ERIC|nr:hypothetical protein RHGRI_029397 [Rhododendron griersonianum]